MEDINVLVQRKKLFQEKIQEIDDLVVESTKKILDAIKNQRWFFFEERTQILFDKDTGLIWANLDDFSWKKNNAEQIVYSDENNYEEVKKVLEETNSKNFGGYDDWEIPTHLELWKLVEDKTFPFCEGNNWNIKKRCYWCVSYQNRPASKDLDDSPADADIRFDHSVFLIPCSHAIALQNISSDPKKILSIFEKNNLIPKFNDEEISKIYRKIFVEKILARKQSLLNQISEIEGKIYEIENEPQLSVVNVDYKTLMEKYNIAEIEKSPIKYYKSVLNFSHDIFRVVYEYEYTYKSIISELSKATIALDEMYPKNSDISEKSKELLQERQKFLSRYLKPGIDVIKDQIMAIKAQSEDFSARIEKINQSANSIKEFAELEKEPRVSFEFLAENIVNMIMNAQKRIDFFILNKKFVSEIVSNWEIWSKDYEFFETNLCEEFVQICRNDGIDENISKNWALDWKEKRFAVEERFLPLIEGALKEYISSKICISALKILQTYKENTDKFYLNERKNIYRKFSSAQNREFHEKLETEIAIQKFNKIFQQQLQKIIFSCEKIDEKHFLLIWFKPLSDTHIDNMMNFIKENNFEEIPIKILTEFDELKNRHFETYLSNIQRYSQAIENYEEDFETILFEMKEIFRKKL